MCAMRGPKHLMQSQAIMQLALGAPQPVVKIAGDDQRRIVRHVAIDTFAQADQLLATLHTCQAEVNANHMHVLIGVR